MDILRTSDGHSSGCPHKIPADAEYWNRMSDRFPLRPQNCLTGIPADVRSLFSENFLLSASRRRGHCVPILRMDVPQMSARNSSGK